MCVLEVCERKGDVVISPTHLNLNSFFVVSWEQGCVASNENGISCATSSVEPGNATVSSYDAWGASADGTGVATCV